MATTVDIPDFNWSAFYYAQLLDALIEYKRQNVPEHTDESPYDPLMQFLRMQALVGHLNNVLIDLVANESTLPTSKLVETVRNMLRLIGYEMSPASPASTDVVFELSKIFTLTTEIIPILSQIATKKQEDVDAIYFEMLTALSTQRTDQLGTVFGEENGVFTDYTIKANSQTTPGDDWTPWATPAVKDKVYFGHSDIVWDKLGIWLTSGASIKATGTIQSVAKANLIDGETFTLNDGANPAAVFEFDVAGDGVAGGNVIVDVSGVTTAQEVATVAGAAINGAANLDVTAFTPPTGGLLFLGNDNYGAVGNVAITETVADAGFVVTGMTGGGNIVGVWEYYDGNWQKVAPTQAKKDVPSAGKILFDLTSYLGANDRTGTIIRAQFNETGAYEQLESAFGIPSGSGWSSSKNYVITAGYLGQTVPSEVAGDYTVGSDWEILDSVTDGTSDMEQSGQAIFTLPQTISRDWEKGTINSVINYWLRYRIVETATPAAPVFQYARIDQGKQYVLAIATQGRTFEEDPLGSSDGTAGQSFEATKEHHIFGSDMLLVEGEQWTRVNNFLSSKPTDKHYRVELTKNDRAVYIFGNGITGKIPPAGVGNISVTYRYGGEDDGNVGANKIEVDKTGFTYVNTLWNPRMATGWSEAEGSTESSLEKAKIQGPASLKTQDVALGPSDVEQKAMAYTDAGGSKLFSRVKAIEEGFGPKTIELIVVVAGGGTASIAQLDALDEHFNGDQYSYPPKTKRLVANQQVTSVNYTEKTINIAATVYGDAEEESIKNRLRQVFQPEALKSDNVTYEWGFGAAVTTSRISHEIFEADEDITRVVLTQPASDVALQTRELPKVGTITITMG